MCSDVYTKVGKANQIMCSDVHTKVGPSYMKMCSDVNGGIAHEICLNVHSILGWLQTKMLIRSYPLVLVPNSKPVPNSKSVLYVLLVGDHPSYGR